MQKTDAVSRLASSPPRWSLPAQVWYRSVGASAFRHRRIIGLGNERDEFGATSYRDYSCARGRVLRMALVRWGGRRAFWSEPYLYDFAHSYRAARFGAV